LDDRAVYVFIDAQCDTPTSCVMTQQKATFWGVDAVETLDGAYDP